MLNMLRQHSGQVER